MSDLNNKYKNIINEIEEKIKNPEELDSVNFFRENYQKFLYPQNCSIIKLY